MAGLASEFLLNLAIFLLALVGIVAEARFQYKHEKSLLDTVRKLSWTEWKENISLIGWSAIVLAFIVLVAQMGVKYQNWTEHQQELADSKRDTQSLMNANNSILADNRWVREELGTLTRASLKYFAASPNVIQFPNEALANQPDRLALFNAAVASESRKPTIDQEPSPIADSSELINKLALFENVKLAMPSDKQNTVTISVDVTDKTLKDQIFLKIDRVVYNLDPRWYAKPIVETRDAANNFQYTFGALGSTKVSAKIFFKNSPTPVIREGAIDPHTPGSRQIDPS